MTNSVYAGGQAQDSKQNVVLLVDGENISHDYAGKLIVAAGKSGEITAKRIYGNASLIPKWDAAPGFRLIHSGSGKNSADILLTIDALEMSWTKSVGTFVIATSDGDFSHLAHHLKERGFGVVGIGQIKAPENFRKSCSSFVELPEIQKALDVVLQPLDPLDVKIREILRSAEDTNGMKIQELGQTMNRRHGVKISTHKKKTWRSYLTAKSELYACDPPGPEACVRIA